MARRLPKAMLPELSKMVQRRLAGNLSELVTWENDKFHEFGRYVLTPFQVAEAANMSLPGYSI